MPRPLRHRLLNATTLASLFLLAITCSLWARSLHIAHQLTRMSDLHPILGHSTGSDVTHTCTATYTILSGGRITFLIRPGSTARPEQRWSYHESPLPSNTPLRQFAFDRYHIGPLHGWAIPLWPFALAFATLPSARLIRLTRPRPDAGPRCNQCGYDLRATPTRCPECGLPVTSEATA